MVRRGKKVKGIVVSHVKQEEIKWECRSLCLHTVQCFDRKMELLKNDKGDPLGNTRYQQLFGPPTREYIAPSLYISKTQPWTQHTPITNNALAYMDETERWVKMMGFAPQFSIISAQRFTQVDFNVKQVDFNLWWDTDHGWIANNPVQLSLY